jgi:hypothetical protein
VVRPKSREETPKEGKQPGDANRRAAVHKLGRAAAGGKHQRAAPLPFLVPPCPSVAQAHQWPRQCSDILWRG